MCCGAYASFMSPIYLDPQLYEIGPEQKQMLLRLIIFVAIGYYQPRWPRPSGQRQIQEVPSNCRGESKPERSRKRDETTERLAALGQLSAGTGS